MFTFEQHPSLKTWRIWLGEPDGGTVIGGVWDSIADPDRCYASRTFGDQTITHFDSMLDATCYVLTTAEHAAALAAESAVETVRRERERRERHVAELKALEEKNDASLQALRAKARVDMLAELHSRKWEIALPILILFTCLVLIVLGGFIIIHGTELQRHACEARVCPHGYSPHRLDGACVCFMEPAP